MHVIIYREGEDNPKSSPIKSDFGGFNLWIKNWNVYIEDPNVKLKNQLNNMRYQKNQDYALQDLALQPDPGHDPR